NVGPLGLGIFLLLLGALYLGNGCRSAAILMHDFLLLGEGYWSGRRRCFGHNWPAQHWAWRAHASFRAAINDAALLRRDRWRYRSDWSRRDLLRVHANHVVMNRSCGCKCLVRDRGHGVHLRLVLIRNVRDVHGLVYVNVVVDVS